MISMVIEGEAVQTRWESRNSEDEGDGGVGVG